VGYRLRRLVDREVVIGSDHRVEGNRPIVVQDLTSLRLRVRLAERAGALAQVAPVMGAVEALVELYLRL
jgi:hypothetical protein